MNEDRWSESPSRQLLDEQAKFEKRTTANSKTDQSGASISGGFTAWDPHSNHHNKKQASDSITVKTHIRDSSLELRVLEADFAALTTQSPTTARPSASSDGGPRRSARLRGSVANPSSADHHIPTDPSHPDSPALRRSARLSMSKISSTKDGEFSEEIEGEDGTTVGTANDESVIHFIPQTKRDAGAIASNDANSIQVAISTLRSAEKEQVSHQTRSSNDQADHHGLRRSKRLSTAGSSAISPIEDEPHRHLVIDTPQGQRNANGGLTERLAFEAALRASKTQMEEDVER